MWELTVRSNFASLSSTCVVSLSYIIEFPYPVNYSTSFLDQLKAANLDFAIKAFKHYLGRPAKSSNRLDELIVMEWCKQMDTLLISMLGILHMTYN